MPEEDMDKFLAEVNRQDDKWRAALLTLIGSSIRIGGLLALEWNDIDIENNTMIPPRKVILCYSVPHFRS